MLKKILVFCDASVSNKEKFAIGAFLILDKEKLDAAVTQIKAIVEDPKVGSVFDGKVTKILDFGAFVEFAPGREGLVHISELDWTRVNKVEDVVSVGDKVKIKLFEIDKQGRLNFSIKRHKDKPE